MKLNLNVLHLVFGLLLALCKTLLELLRLVLQIYNVLILFYELVVIRRRSSSRSPRRRSPTRGSGGLIRGGFFRQLGDLLIRKTFGFNFITTEL